MYMCHAGAFQKSLDWPCHAPTRASSFKQLVAEAHKPDNRAATGGSRRWVLHSRGRDVSSMDSARGKPSFGSNGPNHLRPMQMRLLSN